MKGTLSSPVRYSSEPVWGGYWVMGANLDVERGLQSSPHEFGAATCPSTAAQASMQVCNVDDAHTRTHTNTLSFNAW